MKFSRNEKLLRNQGHAAAQAAGDVARLIGVAIRHAATASAIGAVTAAIEASRTASWPLRVKNV